MVARRRASSSRRRRLVTALVVVLIGVCIAVVGIAAEESSVLEVRPGAAEGALVIGIVVATSCSNG